MNAGSPPAAPAVTGTFMAHYAFAPVDPPAAVRGPIAEYLDVLWKACDHAGMTETVLPGLPTRLPSRGPLEGPFRVVAAKQRADGTARTYVFAEHDVLGVVTGFSLHDEEAGTSGWARIREQWDPAVTSSPAGLIGEATVFAALTRLAPARIAERWGPLVPSVLGQRIVDGDAAYVTERGFAVWELNSGDARRVLAVLAPDDRRTELARWLWWDEASAELTLPPLARYLLHAAKLRYEYAVFREGMHGMRRRQDEMDAALAGLFAFHAAANASGDVSIASLVEQQSRLATAQGEPGGLLVALTRTRELAQTVRIATRNLRSRVPPPFPGFAVPAASPFARDEALGEWLGTQIDHDIAYAEAVRERAREAETLTRLRLDQAHEENAAQQRHLTLIQTTTVAAAVGALGLAEAFRLEIPHPPRQPLLVLVVLFALSLAIPFLAARRPRRLTHLDRAAAGAVGGAVLALMASYSPYNADAEVATAAALGAVAGVLAQSAVHRLQRARPRAVTPPAGERRGR